jgi:hypothetical protein
VSRAGDGQIIHLDRAAGGDLTVQNRYVGDIGDYVKLGILRMLMPGYRLGVAWWLHPDDAYNDHGRQIGYLSHPEKWRHFDPPLFDALQQIVTSGRRDVRSLETANLLPGAIFASTSIPDGPILKRRQVRRQWFTTVQRTLNNADLVFVDPDNGLESEGYRHGSAKAGKSILLTEIQGLARRGRCVIVYHHQTRRKGGHLGEIEHWADRLRDCGFSTVDALRARPYSPRLFLMLDAPEDVRQRAEQIVANWQGRITWHPDRTIGDGSVRAQSEHRPTAVPPPTVAPRIVTSILAAPLSRSKDGR